MAVPSSPLFTVDGAVLDQRGKLKSVAYETWLHTTPAPQFKTGVFKVNQQKTAKTWDASKQLWIGCLKEYGNLILSGSSQRYLLIFTLGNWSNLTNIFEVGWHHLVAIFMVTSSLGSVLTNLPSVACLIKESRHSLWWFQMCTSANEDSNWCARTVSCQELTPKTPIACTSRTFDSLYKIHLFNPQIRG